MFVQRPSLVCLVTCCLFSGHVESKSSWICGISKMHVFGMKFLQKKSNRGKPRWPFRFQIAHKRYSRPVQNAEMTLADHSFRIFDIFYRRGDGVCPRCVLSGIKLPEKMESRQAKRASQASTSAQALLLTCLECGEDSDGSQFW